MEIVEVVRKEYEDGSVTLVSRKPVSAKKAAFYVAKNKSKWLVDYEMAMYIMESGRTCYKYQRMGKSRYVIVYPEDSRHVLDGIIYIMGEFMIMGLDKSLVGLTQEEMQEAISEYTSRSVILQIAGRSISAYQIG